MYDDRIRQDRESGQALEELRRRLEMERVRLVQERVVHRSHFTWPSLQGLHYGMGPSVRLSATFGSISLERDAIEFGENMLPHVCNWYHHFSVRRVKIQDHTSRLNFSIDAHCTGRLQTGCVEVR